jgi:hypothetical protein
MEEAAVVSMAEEAAVVSEEDTGKTDCCDSVECERGA